MVDRSGLAGRIGGHNNAGDGAGAEAAPNKTVRFGKPEKSTIWGHCEGIFFSKILVVILDSHS